MWRRNPTAENQCRDRIRPTIESMPPNPMPQAVLTYRPEDGTYGFSVWFEGQRPRHIKEGFLSKQSALWWMDPHNEYVWDETPSSDGRVLAIARQFKPGSVSERMLNWREQRSARTQSS
jgi:hypothetical protein